MAAVGEVDSKGHLELEEDPEAWIKNNPASRLALVTSLKLDLYPKEEIGESIGEFTHLIRLEFWDCTSLKRVPNAITRLHKLEHLLFDSCSRLEELPENIGQLASLTHLELSHCENIKYLPNSIVNLSKLTSLTLSDCESLVELPANIGQLASLTHLEICSCDNIESLPMSVANLPKLTSLSLSSLSLSELPCNLGDLKRSLTGLDLLDCKNIKYLPNSIVNLSKLTSLTLDSCESLVKLPANIGQLRSLTHLELRSCREIDSLPMKVANLPKLTSLSLYYLFLSKLPCNLGDLKKSLTRLDLYHCKDIKYLPNSIVNLSNLTSLSLKSCESLVELPADIGQLVSLTQLKLDSCNNIKSLPMSIANLSNLTSLTLTICDSLTELPSNLGQMKSLSHLELNNCNKIKSLPDSMKDLCSLDTLFISTCNSLTHLPINLNVLHLELIECCPRFLPTGLINLKYLRVTVCSCSDESFVNWKDPYSLQHLAISSCFTHKKYIITLPTSLSQFVNLQVLSLHEYHYDVRFVELPANLDGLAHLCLLDIQYSSISCLPWSITKLHKLRHLMLYQNFRLETLPYELNNSVIISVLNRHVRKSWEELRTEIGQLSIPFGGDIGNNAAQNPSILSHPGYLRLEGDPSQWLINNRNSIMLVRLLELLYVGKITESIMQFSDLTHLYLQISLPAKDFCLLDNYFVTLTRLAHLSLHFFMVKFDKSTIHSLSKLSNLQTLHLCFFMSELPENFNMPVSLKHLSLSNCNMRPLYYSLEKLTNLKTLDLNTCVYCESLPPSMYLDKLRLIDCSFESLDSLPIGLHHLEILFFKIYKDLGCMFEESWNQLVNLETLSITCSKMEFLPEDIARLSNLQKLQLKDCVSLEKLPSNLHELVNLHTLDISVTGIKTLPLSFVKQCKLQHLTLPKCFNVQCLPRKLKNVYIIDDTEEAYYKRKGYDASLYQTSADSFDESEETELGVVPRESCNEDNNVVPTVELHEIVPDEQTFADPFNSTSTCHIGHITTEQGGVSQIYKDSHSYVSKDPIDENLQHTAVYPQNQFNPLGNGGFMTNLPGAYSFGVNNQHAINDGQIGTMTFGNAHEIAPIFQHISSRGGNSFTGARNNDHALEFGRNNNTSQSYDADAIRQGRGITPEATLALLPATNMRLVDAAENLDDSQLNVSKDPIDENIQHTAWCSQNQFNSLGNDGFMISLPGTSSFVVNNQHAINGGHIGTMTLESELGIVPIYQHYASCDGNSFIGDWDNDHALEFGHNDNTSQTYDADANFIRERREFTLDLEAIVERLPTNMRFVDAPENLDEFCFSRRENSNPEGESIPATHTDQNDIMTTEINEQGNGDNSYHDSENEQNQIPQNNNVKGKKGKDITLETLQQFWSKNMTLEEAANKIGVSRSTMKRRLKYLKQGWASNRKGKQHLDATKRKHNKKAPIGSDCLQQNLVNPGNLAAHPEIVGGCITGADQLTFPNHVASASITVNNLTPNIRIETIRENRMETQGNMDSHRHTEEHLDGANEHTFSDTLQQNENSGKFIVKATYKDDLARVEFNLSKSINQLKEEVGKRLDIEAGTFKLKYQDEEKDWIVMTCTADLEHALNLSRSSNVVRLLVVLIA